MKYPKLYPKLNQYLTEELFYVLLGGEKFSLEDTFGGKFGKIYESYKKTGMIESTEYTIIHEMVSRKIDYNSHIIVWLFMVDNREISLINIYARMEIISNFKIRYHDEIFNRFVNSPEGKLVLSKGQG